MPFATILAFLLSDWGTYNFKQFTSICIHLFWVHLPLVHTHCLKCHGLHSQVRMCYGFLWVETDWKETLPRRQLSKRPTAKMYKRTKSVFVQVFHIGPVPDIFLNGTKVTDDFRNHNFFLSSDGSSQIPGSVSFLRNLSAGHAVLYLCLQITQHSSSSCHFYSLGFFISTVNLSVMDIYDGACRSC